MDPDGPFPSLVGLHLTCRSLGRRCDEALFCEKRVFSEKGGGGRNSVNGGLGKDFYRKGNAVKRSGYSVNRRTLKTKKLLSSFGDFLRGG